MIYKETKKLSLKEREFFKKKIDKSTELGVVIPNVFSNKDYDGMIVVPFEWENDISKILVFDNKTNKDYAFNLYDKVFGNYELTINDDIINLSIE